MKQTINKILIGLSLVLLLVLPYKMFAQMQVQNTDIVDGGGGGGSSTTNTPASSGPQFSVTADLDKGSYIPGEKINVISSAVQGANLGSIPGAIVSGSIVNSVVAPVTIIDNSQGGSNIYGTAILTAPTTAGSYIFRVEVNVPSIITTWAPGICDSSNGDYIEQQNQYDGLGNVTKPGGYWVCITNPPAPVPTYTAGPVTKLASFDTNFTVENLDPTCTTSFVPDSKIDTSYCDGIISAGPNDPNNGMSCGIFPKDSCGSTSPNGNWGSHGCHWTTDSKNIPAHNASICVTVDDINLPLVNSGTKVSWKANGLDKDTAHCSSPQKLESNGSPSILIYPEGKYETGTLPKTTKFTVTCQDKSVAVPSTTPVKQFVSTQGPKGISIGDLDWRAALQSNPSGFPSIINGVAVIWSNSIEFFGGPWYDLKALPQLATISFDTTSPVVDTIGGFARNPLSIKKGDLDNKFWVVPEDGTYKIDFYAKGVMKTKISDRGGFISVINYYLKINNDKFPMEPYGLAGHGNCINSPMFSLHPVQYSSTQLKDCDPSNTDRHAGYEAKTSYNINYTKTVDLKAGDAVDIKANYFGESYSSSWFSFLNGSNNPQFFLDSQSTNITVTKLK